MVSHNNLYYLYCLLFFYDFVLDDLYCSDATEISSDDEADEINFGVGLDDVEGLIDKWIPPISDLAKSIYEIIFSNVPKNIIYNKNFDCVFRLLSKY